MRDYSNDAMGELASELCSGLNRLRKGYVDSAEQLLNTIEQDQEYPYEFVVFKLTAYRPKSSGGPRCVFDGATLSEDLVKLILDVSKNSEIRTSDYSEKVYTNKSLSQYLDVSEKTIGRWRKKRLPARSMIFPDERRRLGFLQSSVDRYCQENRKQVTRSSKFAQMSDSEKKEIIAAARKIVGNEELGLSDVARRIAKSTGRSVEAIRYTIRNHDSSNPDSRIFSGATESLSDEDRWRLFGSYMNGVSVSTLAERYHRKRSSIYRIVNEMRASQLADKKITYVHNEIFDDPSAENEIMAPLERVVEEESEKKKHRVKPPADFPPYLKNLYKFPLLSPAEEQHIFRQYNYIKYKADKLRDKILEPRVSAKGLKDIDNLLIQANVLKNRIVRSNLRLVVSIATKATKHLSGSLSLFELISDGNLSLMRAVEKFDYAKGFRFSTYASWAIIKNYARSVPKEKYQLDRFSTGHEELLDVVTSLRTYDPSENDNFELKESIGVLLDHLSPRERTILVDHYGLGDSSDTMTFQQLGDRLGISKERVRQIEIQALGKLKDITDSH